MRRSHASAFAILILLGAGGVWFASGLSTEPQHVPDAARGAATTGSAPARAGGDEAASERELAGVEPAAPAEAAAAAPTPPPAPTGRLRVIVHDERGRALAGCHVSAAALEASTDETGTANFEVEAARTFVAVDPPTGHTLRGCSGWQTVRAGTTTELTIVLAPAAPNLVFWCQLVDAENGRALPDVAVRQQPGDTELRSDGDGFVQVAIQDDGAFLDARAAGRCPCRILPEAGHEAKAAAMRVPLASGCTLQVQTVDAAGSPVAGVEVRVSAMPWHLQCPPEVRPRGEEFVWTATSDVQGRLVIADLPLGVAVEVGVAAPAAFAAIEPQHWSFAAAREERRIELAAAGVVYGVVTDAEGAAVAGVTVRASATAAGVIGQVFELVVAHRKMTTGADGTFRLTGLSPGRWWVGIRHDGKHQPTSVAVDVVAGGAVELALQARAGLAVAGRAVAADGSACRGVTIQITIDGTILADVDTDHDGRFRFAHLPAGACALSTEPSETDMGLQEPVTVQAGDEQVELRLVAVNGSISGRISVGTDAWVMATCRGNGNSLGSNCELDGTFFYRGLRVGTWDLAAFDRTGRTGNLGGVQVLPGRETAGVVLEMVPGAMLRLRHQGADEFVVCNGAHVVAGDSLQDGLTGEARVPAGTWTVVFRQRGREVGRRDVTVRAGENRVVDGGR